MSVGCRVVADTAGDSIALTFVLRNDGDEPVEIERFEPLLAFGLRVRAGGEEVPVRRAQFDLPVQAVSDTLAPGGELQLETPVQLAFAREGEEPSAWTWLIDAPPQPVELEATLELGERRCIAAVSVP